LPIYAADHLAAVERERIPEDVKQTIVVFAIAIKPVRHSHGCRLTAEVSRRGPIAQALRMRRRRSVGIRDRESLRLLIAIDARGEHLQRRKLARWQRHRLARDYILRIGPTELKQNAVPHL